MFGNKKAKNNDEEYNDTIELNIDPVYEPGVSTSNGDNIPITNYASYADDEEKDEDHEVSLNVISKKEFESRVTSVFNAYYDVLSKSFGPFGSTTIICKYPYNHTTKDGFTIAKSISVDVSNGYTDQAIADMAVDICGRINTAVGDGTTTAIICTNNIYKSYIEHKDELLSIGVAPRDILQMFAILKQAIRNKLQEEAVEINYVNEKEFNAKNDPETTLEIEMERTMIDNIRKVVNISANGDESIVHNIIQLYDQMGYPSITCEKSPDGVERMEVVKGYRSHVSLTDKLYVNSDDDVAKYYDADVLIFECPISEDIYTNIISPILMLSQACDRHLVVIAPSYDNVVLDRMIIPALTNEFSKRQDVSLVLTIAKMSSPYDKKAMSDLATLCHTKVLTRPFVSDLISEVKKLSAVPSNESWYAYPIYKFIGTLRPWIRDISYPALNIVDMKIGSAGHLGDEEDDMKLIESSTKGPGRNIFIPGLECDDEVHYFNLGYCRDIEIGNKTSIMRDFFYDENEYKIHIEEAKDDLAEVMAKYKKLGTFNTETNKAKERLYALTMKLAVIEVGGDSELSIGLRKDVYDDAIKAADSAYKYGTVLGCNVNTICAIDDLRYVLDEILPDATKTEKNLALTLLSIIRDGFIETYRTVLTNWMPDEEVCVMKAVDGPYCYDPKDPDVLQSGKAAIDTFSIFWERKCHSKWKDHIITVNDDTPQEQVLVDLINDVFARKSELVPEWHSNDFVPITFYDIIIAYSISSYCKEYNVFDVINKKFSTDIINSFQTDDEILNAVVDLLSLLISGNQMIVTQKRSFDE